jgi:hypothetical protein
MEPANPAMTKNETRKVIMRYRGCKADALNLGRLPATGALRVTILREI